MADRTQPLMLERAFDPVVRVSSDPPPAENKGFKAARTGRRSASFESERQHVNTAVQKGGALLRGRSRFFCEENPLGIGGRDTWGAYAVGTGLMPVMRGVRAPVKRAWMKAFFAWAKVCDFDGNYDLFGIMLMAAWEYFTVGEIFLRKMISADQPVQIQALASEQLPYLNSGRDVPPGNVVRLGIEFNAKGKKVAYHFYRYHPQDSTAPAGSRTVTERVPADQVIHLFRATMPGQIRGVPQTRGALIPGSLLDDYEDALLERARAGTRPIAAIEKTEVTDDGSSGEGAASTVAAGANDNKDGSATLDLEPGTMFDLEVGEKLSTIEPPDPGANYREFRFSQSTRATSAMAVPNAEVTGDLRDVNFSSMRGGRMPFKRKIEQFQFLKMVPQMLDPIWAWFATDALLFGTVTLPRGASRALAPYSDIAWNGPKWEYVNPKEDAETDVLLVDNLLKPRSAVIAETGEDPESVDEQIAQDQERETKLKLVRRQKTAPAQAGAKPAAEPPKPRQRQDA